MTGRKTRGVAAHAAEPKFRTEALNRVLERERSRADRSRQDLSLVLMGFDGQRAGKADPRVIHDTLVKRARGTDVIGWFDKRTSFAVLPDTGAAGARCFADQVRQMLTRRGIRSSFAIYEYKPVEEMFHIDQDGPGGRQIGMERRGVTPDRRHHGAIEPAVAMKAPRWRNPQHSLEPAMTLGLPWWKRGLDIAVAVAMLAVLWPLLVAIAVAIKAEARGSRGGVLFYQKRAGLGGKPFWIYKFRTMKPNAETMQIELRLHNEQDGPAFKLRRDPRITRIGALLRKTSLDELPQLINILRGEMTLVGPRPLPMHESDGCSAWQRRRLLITPGLTCIWQVYGRSTVSFDEWVRMDLSYLRRRTLWHDVKLMLATVPAVMKQRGAC